MIEEVKEEVEKEIIRLFKNGSKINEISDSLRVPDISVSRVLNKNKDMILNVKKEVNSLKGDYEEDDRIKTIKTISKLHEQTLQLVDEARKSGRPELALQAMKEAREQTSLIMRNKGELTHDSKQGDVIPPEFLDYFFEKIKKQISKENKGNEVKKLNGQTSKTEKIVNQTEKTDISNGV